MDTLRYEHCARCLILDPWIFGIRALNQRHRVIPDDIYGAARDPDPHEGLPDLDGPHLPVLLPGTATTQS
jgi:hypothetical protein